MLYQHDSCQQNNTYKSVSYLKNTTTWCLNDDITVDQLSAGGQQAM
jgi:hypothetical protein